MKDGRKQVKRAELNKRPRVILLIQAKCFKVGRTEKGQTAVKMKARKPKRERKGDRTMKLCMKEDIVSARC